MRIEQSSTSDDAWRFLMALNRSLIPTFAGLRRVPAPPPLMFYLRVTDEALHRQTQEAFVCDLRRLADEWIETARDASGEGEDPTKRKLTRDLRRIVNQYWAWNRPDVEHEYSGDLVLSMPVRRVNFKGEGVLLEPVDAAKQEAVRWFAQFLDSPYRYRLCKCRKCSEYYYTQRRPKGYIEYGTYCPRDRHVASAMRSYAQKQGPAHDRRLSLAAQWWGKWPKDIRGNVGKQAQWIAKKVNDNVSPKWTRISRNWVTRHRLEIERRSRALNAAPTGFAANKAAIVETHSNS